MAQAIDLAAHRWPGEPRSRLLLRLVDVGKAALDEDQNTAIRKRQAAVKASSGKYSDGFSPNYLSELRKDWPE